MYWPLGTPRIYATNSSRQPGSLQIISDDGLPPATGRSEQRLDRPSLLSPNSATLQDGSGASSALGPTTATAPLTPLTPITPLTPGIKPVEHEYLDHDDPRHSPGPTPLGIPLHEPILALRVARASHI